MGFDNPLRHHPARTLLALAVGFGLVAGSGPALASFSPAEIGCRAAIGKSAARLAKTVAKTIAGCHKSRARDAGLAGTDCNEIGQADRRGKVPRLEQKLTSAIESRCSGLAPADVQYDACPAPCSASVPTVTTMADVASCLTCVAREIARVHGQTVHGTPASPLSSEVRRCELAIGSSSSRLFAHVARDVTRCQAREEAAGAMTVEFCTDTAFPAPAIQQRLYDAKNKVVNACDVSSFDGLDSCAASQFGIADCVGDETLAAAQDFARAMLTLPVTSTTTTTITTTTTLPPIVGDPQCPDLAELVLFSRDSNVACTTNADCEAPRTCDPSIGICVSLSDLDSGWTGHAHDSDLDDGVVTLTRLACPGPAPVCGECVIQGVDPAAGNCRCANDTRTICDEPFRSDADDCGGATCDCYFGVPIPLSSAGTPACIVNRYSEDLTGTANVDLGESEVAARLRTRVYLGITTTQPCPICGGKCSHSPTTACAYDDDCGAGNTCLQDTPNDGVRDGLCIEGDHDDLPCDVAGINPSFPARSGARVGGGGYSLDCMPAVGINISGAGLKLGVTQTTGVTTLEANLPCTGGECHCKTCSASPQTPCNNDGDCAGGSCAVSSNFACSDDSDCTGLDLGNCTGINRCQLATSVSCTTNADCKNRSGGPCNPSSCTALGGGGVAPRPNECTGGLCSDLGDGESQCTDGPDDKMCDGLVRANGQGILSCSNNSDCTANDPLNGTCSLLQRRACFPEVIVATGSADTEFPVGAAAFCVPPTSNTSINSVAGLPGPARVVNQGRSRTFCASDHDVEYEPGAGGCPPPP